MTNNAKPIVEPSDVKNLNIRVAETPLRVDTFEELGAIPTVMAFSEVYGALQQGALDAQENPLSNTVAPRFYEVQDYLSLTGHFYNTVMLMVETETWEEISQEDQKIILEEMEKASENVQNQNDDMEDSYIQTLEDNGMAVNDDVDKESFRETLLPIYDQWEEEVFGKELMDIYREVSGWEE
jgi:TRAP-type C4-dicarboxylate transport system substrate-binding protein